MCGNFVIIIFALYSLLIGMVCKTVRLETKGAFIIEFQIKLVYCSDNLGWITSIEHPIEHLLRFIF